MNCPCKQMGCDFLAYPHSESHVTVTSEQNPALNDLRPHVGHQIISILHCRVIRVNVYRTVNASLIRAQLLFLFECTSGRYQRWHEGIVFLVSKYTWLKPPPLFATNYSEWTCMCLPFQASHFCAVTRRTPPIRNIDFSHVLTVKMREFTSKKQKQWRYATISHESKYWAALFYWKFF